MKANGAGSRFNKALGTIKTQKIDGLLLNSEANVSYLCGFHASDSYLIASKKGIIIVTDFRYVADFRKKANPVRDRPPQAAVRRLGRLVSNGAKPPVEIVGLKGTIFKTICDVLVKESIKNVGFESRHLAFAECQALHELSKNRITWIPLKDTVEHLREIKDSEELTHIRKAIRITLQAYDFIKKQLKHGMKELQVAAELERFIRLAGATSSAFEIIVASGPNSSYPHAQISDRTIRTGEPIVIDMGVTINGYKSDLTRTFFLGRINPVVRRLDMIVREAQRMAIRAVKPGALIKDIDSAARNHIKEKGFGKYFGHALGHGVGLEVHESPSINCKNELPVKKGMVFTIEPGIYIPGSYGIRQEEMVLVTANGVEVLSGNCRH